MRNNSDESSSSHHEPSNACDWDTGHQEQSGTMSLWRLKWEPADHFTSESQSQLGIIHRINFSRSFSARILDSIPQEFESWGWEIGLGSSHKVTFWETTRLQQQVGILDCGVRPAAEKTSSFIHPDWMQMPSVRCRLSCLLTWTKAVFFLVLVFPAHIYLIETMCMSVWLINK